MLTDISLKVETVKNNNKFHENLFGIVLNSLMSNIPKWSDAPSKSYSK